MPPNESVAALQATAGHSSLVVASTFVQHAVGLCCEL